MTGLVSPFGFDAVQWKIWVVTGWKISSVMSVSVRVGFTPVQFGFGHPAVAASTVGAAVKVAGFVANVKFPFLIALAGIAVSEVAGPSRTVLAGRSVAAPILALVERKAAHSKVDIKVLIAKPGKSARTCDGNARRAGKRA